MTAKFVVQNNTVYHPGWTGMNGTNSLIRTGEYSYVVPADFCKSAMSVLMVATQWFAGRETGYGAGGVWDANTTANVFDDNRRTAGRAQEDANVTTSAPVSVKVN